MLVAVARGSRGRGEFAKWLSEQVQRRGRHLVLREAARLLEPTSRGFSKSVLSRKEAGELPTALQLFALARVLGVSADSILAMIAADHGVAVDDVAKPQVLGRDAERLARWFDQLSADRQQGILTALAVPESVGARRSPR